MIVQVTLHVVYLSSANDLSSTTTHTHTQSVAERCVLPAGLPSGPTAAPVPFLLSKLLKKFARTPVSLVDAFSLLLSGYKPINDSLQQQMSMNWQLAWRDGILLMADEWMRTNINTVLMMDEVSGSMSGQLAWRDGILLIDEVMGGGWFDWLHLLWVSFCLLTHHTLAR